MKLLFLGSVYPNNLLDIYINNSISLDLAANTLQWSLISGLKNLYKVRIISIPLVKSKYNKSLPTYQFKCNNDDDFEKVSTPQSNVFIS